jgi:hypothetical protein
VQIAHQRKALEPVASKWEVFVMRWSWNIGKLPGINVYVHATFLFLILFISAAYTSLS